MGNMDRDALRNRLDTMDSEVLKVIYQKNDTYEWTDDAFQEIANILKKRGEEIPEQFERRYAVFVIDENHVSENEADRKIWEKNDLSASDVHRAKSMNREDTEEWKDCDISEEGYPYLECSQCKKNYGLDLSEISPEKNINSRNLVYAGDSETMTGRGCVLSAKVIAIFISILIGSAISAGLKAPPFVYAILSVVLYPLIWLATLFLIGKTKAGEKRVDYWFFKCPNCSNTMVIVSTGTAASFTNI